MIKKWTIREKFIYSILVGILIPFLIGGFYLESFVKNWLYSNNFEVNERILNQATELIDYSLVSNVEEKVKMLSEVDVIKNVNGDLNNYVDFNAESFEYNENINEQKIEDVFEIIKKSNLSVNFIFFGTENGEYIEFPRFNPTKNYDPRQRPWYEGTINNEGFVISDPYITNVTGDLVISIMTTVKKDFENIGVVGISVDINEITNSINQIRIGESGYLIIMNERDKFVVSPKEPAWLLKTPTELNIKALMNLNENSDMFVERNINGVDSILNVVISKKSGWKMISVIDKSELLKQSKAIRSVFSFIYLVTLFIIMFIVYNISIRITKPILDLSNAIAEMAQFKFGLKDKEKITVYSKKEDELGTMSKALIEMNSNFVALMDQVDVLNNEIKNVDIENKSNQKVYLAKENPFYIVVESMNTLLDKVNLYLEKLKKIKY